MTFDVYEHILLANSNEEKILNYQIAKRVDLVVIRKVETLNELIIDIAEQTRAITAAVRRKKTMAKDAISNVVEGKFG